MSGEDEAGIERNARQEKKKKYIPGLAAFKFWPDPDWTHEEAERMFRDAVHDLGHYETDTTYFEDCISEMRKLPDECVDLIIADPPFGLGFSGKESIYNRDENYVVEGYREVEESYWRFSHEWIDALPRIMKENASVYVFSGWTNLEAVLAAIRNAGLTTINHLIWKYQFGVFTRTKFVSSHYHLLFVAKDPDRYYFRKFEHYPLDVWDINRSYRPGKQKNGTTLPVDLIEKCIRFSSRPGDLVLDPFMGNGTTAMATKGLWRHYLGFEINRKLQSVIRQNVRNTPEGSSYIMYKERFPEIIEELRGKYPKAYRVWMSQECSGRTK